MNLTFSLNQLEQYALSEARFDEIRSITRRAAGIPVGDIWGHREILNFVTNDVLHYKDDYKETVFSVRGQEFGLTTILQAISVHAAMEELNRSIQLVHLGFRSVKFAYKAKKTLIELIDGTEW
jgi:hypothetical protein